MSHRWSAAAYACLSVALQVAEPGQISITTQDRVRLDRVAEGGIARHGELLAAGTNALHLEAGTYVFRTAHDAVVDLAAAAVIVTSMRGKDDPDLRGGKDIPPDPDLYLAKGDGAPGPAPVLTVLR